MEVELPDTEGLGLLYGRVTIQMIRFLCEHNNYDVDIGNINILNSK